MKKVIQWLVTSLRPTRPEPTSDQLLAARFRAAVEEYNKAGDALVQAGLNFSATAKSRYSSHTTSIWDERLRVDYVSRTHRNEL